MFVVICALCICFDYIMFVFLKRERLVQSVPMVEIIPDRPRRIDENDIMFLCTPQVVGKPDIGIEFTDRKTLLPRVTYRNIGKVSKYELYIQLKSKKL